MSTEIKIGLISMPQSLTAMPSIGLTQLKSMIKRQFGTRISTDIIYACLDYVSYIGLAEYKQLEANSLNEWMFDREAFPEKEDNTESVKAMFFSGGKTAIKDKVFEFACQKKSRIGQFLNKLITDHDLLQYDILGFTSVTSQNLAIYALARYIKKLKPSCIIVIGGPNCDYPMGRVIIDRIKEIDYVFAGPSIISFEEFLRCVLGGNIEGTHGIDGVFSKRNMVADSMKAGENREVSAELRIVASRGRPHDLNMCLDIDYQDYLKQFESFKKATGYSQKPELLFETSRGCWKRDGLACTFCGLNDPGQCFESMDVKNAIQYINEVVGKHPGDYLPFGAVDSILDKRYIKEVLPYIKMPENAAIMYETSANLTRDEMITCAKSGAKFLQPGIESINTTVLRYMKKGITAFTNILFLKNCIETGIYPIWNLLCGIPEETGSSHFLKLVEDLPLIRHLPPPASFNQISFVRFSPYFEKADSYGLDLKPHPKYSLLYPFEQQDIKDMAWVFTDNRQGAYKKNADRFLPMINREVVEWMMAFRAYEDFPRLCFLKELSILDSRFDMDDPEIHNISSLEREVLLALRKPMTLKLIEEELSHRTGGQIEETLESLCEMNLLFREEEKYLSLVCEDFRWNRKDYLRLNDIIAASTSEVFG